MLELLLPQRCLACGQPGAQVCEPCVAALPRLRPPFCERCGAPTEWPVRRCAECAGRRIAFASARAAVAYDQRVRSIVAGWKEHGLRRLAALAADVVAAQLPRPDANVLAYVPADRDRGLKRGHHPAERLARELGARWELPVLDSLRRRGGAPRQRGLDVAARRRNVRGAFTARKTSGSVCLLDDVYTSGATASAAASTLRAAGARRVEVVTFARALRLR